MLQPILAFQQAAGKSGVATIQESAQRSAYEVCAAREGYCILMGEYPPGKQRRQEQGKYGLATVRRPHDSSMAV